MEEFRKLLISFKKRLDKLERVLIIRFLRMPEEGAFAPPIVTADPASPVEGDIWYRSDLHVWRGQKNGSTVTFTTS